MGVTPAVATAFRLGEMHRNAKRPRRRDEALAQMSSGMDPLV